jgi:hypothetical protein
MTAPRDHSHPPVQQRNDGEAGSSGDSASRTPALEDQLETLILINAEIAGRLDRQTSAGSQVDTKAALLGGIVATATQFLASRKPVDHLLATCAYGFYALAFLAAVSAYALARYNDVPDPRGLVRTSAHQTKARALAYLVGTRVDVFEANAEKHKRKVCFWWISVGCLAVGLGFSAAAIVHTGHHA